MAINEMFPQLPSAGAAQMSDIICAVQGYNGTPGSGTTVQETLGQLYALFQSTPVLAFTGNPNGNVPGIIYQFCWDTIDGILYICNVAGTASTAVWQKVITLTGGSGVTITQNGSVIQISASASGVSWNNVTGTSATMITNNAYQANNSSLVTLTLPSVASFGDVLEVSGFGSGGWRIVQLSDQQLIIGSAQTTVGSGGSLSSNNRYDSISFRCAVANTIWEAISGPQGYLTYV